MVFTAATETALPALIKPLFDQGFGAAKNPNFSVWWIPIAILGIFFVRGLAGFVGAYAMSWIAHNVLRDIRQAIFEKLLVMPAASFDSKSAGQLISRIISEVNGVTAATTSIVATLVRDSLTLAGLMAWLIWLNWRLTLIVVILFPLLALITLSFSRRMRRLSRGALGATGEMARVVEEVIFGNRIVKIFQGAPYERVRFKKASALYRGSAMRLVIAQALQTPMSQFIAAIGLSTVLVVALLQARAGTTTVGDFASFVAAMLMMFGPLRHLADLNAQLQRGLAAAESVFSLIDENSEIDTGVVQISRAAGRIHFDSIYLSYANKSSEALSDIRVLIEPGEKVALVGPSGGGKTSFVNLIPRLYEPSRGCIYLDDTPLNKISLMSLRRQIAFVSQDIVLFNDTVFNNVAYGSRGASEQAVREALEASFLQEFVCSLPKGIQTTIGDRGVQLSGGQRQRLAIARALLKDAPILILDEATSALDSESERYVQQALEKLCENKTTLIVAHRLETTRTADRILVFEGGRIVEEGTHDHLLRSKGTYAMLYKTNIGAAGD